MAVDVVVWRVRDSFYPCLGDDIVLIQEEGLRGQQSSLSFSSLEGKTCRFMVASLSPPYIHQTNFSPSYIPTSNTSSASQHHHKPLSPSPLSHMETTSSLLWSCHILFKMYWKRCCCTMQYKLNQKKGPCMSHHHHQVYKYILCNARCIKI